MDDGQTRKRGEFFADSATSKAILDGFMRLAIAKHAEKSKHLISPENHVRIRHGGAWTSPGSPETRNGGLRTHSAVQEVSFEDILNHDLTLVDRLSDELADNFARQMAEMVYGFIQQVCDSTGNVVTATPEIPFHERIYQALEKIEYTVGKDGQVQRPALHVNPTTYDQLLTTSKTTTPEFDRRFEALDAKKEAEALAKEAERRAKFRKYGDDA